LDGDYNLRRLERYLTMVWDGGVRPVVILNKRDLCGEIHSRVAEAEKASLGAPVFAISAVTGEGLSPVLQTVPSGATLVLIGSSGTGKSTLTNRLMQSELQATQTVRVGDSRGRHTTSSRQLFVLPGGEMLIDTPGLRELQLWETPGGLQRAFADIEELARRCRFDDCSHHAEPGCAVELAVASGELPAERLENYRKLNREREFLDRKVNPEARARERKMLKRVGREVRRLYERREREGK